MGGKEGLRISKYENCMNASGVLLWCLWFEKYFFM